MPSATASKKEIIDFLWEWANSHGDWGKLLVDAIVRTERGLDPIERQDIFDHFLDSLRANKEIPAGFGLKASVSSHSESYRVGLPPGYHRSEPAG